MPRTLCVWVVPPPPPCLLSLPNSRNASAIRKPGPAGHEAELTRLYGPHFAVREVVEVGLATACVPECSRRRHHVILQSCRVRLTSVIARLSCSPGVVKGGHPKNYHSCLCRGVTQVPYDLFGRVRQRRFSTCRDSRAYRSLGVAGDALLRPAGHDLCVMLGGGGGSAVVSGGHRCHHRR